MTDKPVASSCCTRSSRWPAPTKQNTGKAHGSALGDDEVAATKELLGFDPEQTLRGRRRRAGPRPRGRRPRRSAARRVADDRTTRGAPPTPSGAALLDRLRAPRAARRAGEALPAFPADARAWPPAPRPARCSPRSADVLPELWGGSADLAESNNTTMEGEPSSSRPTGRPASGRAAPTAAPCTSASASTPWASILNGIALHGLTRPYGGTFLVFSDYMRPSVRLAAISSCRSPTSGRTTRSASARTARPTSRSSTWPRCAPSRAWTSSARLTPTRPRSPGAPSSSHTDRPAGLALTRQALPVLDRETVRLGRGRRQGRLRPRRRQRRHAPGDARGHRLRGQHRRRPRVSSSQAEGVSTRVVSMPCREWFAAQDQSYRDEVLPPARARPRQRRGRHRRSAGTTSSVTPAASSGSTTTAPPPTTRRSTRSSGSPPRRS